MLQPAPLCTLIALKQRPCVVFSQGYVGRWNESEWRKKNQLHKKSTLRGKWNRAAPGLGQSEDQQHEDNSQGQPFLAHALPASSFFQLLLPKHWFIKHHLEKGFGVQGDGHLLTKKHFTGVKTSLANLLNKLTSLLTGCIFQVSAWWFLMRFLRLWL